MPEGGKPGAGHRLCPMGHRVSLCHGPKGTDRAGAGFCLPTLGACPWGWELEGLCWWSRTELWDLLPTPKTDGWGFSQHGLKIQIAFVPRQCLSEFGVWQGSVMLYWMETRTAGGAEHVPGASPAMRHPMKERQGRHCIHHTSGPSSGLRRGQGLPVVPSPLEEVACCPRPQYPGSHSLPAPAERCQPVLVPFSQLLTSPCVEIREQILLCC